ncbi:HNH endonuclease signature motif containing protein [uncultured Butyricimonas sp.]|uniref:HNH endonuclease signature motif containing protein n=1 Tax=uncultured Butyricimonas sp. TaxID=1268785 RepID=UPI0026DDADA9|nr:HNH endonuclease signature motif containing protein [uncultured Butyricimonas sp.]
MPIKPKPQKRPWVPERVPNDKMQRRVRSAPEYHTSRWTKESRAFRAEHPLCKLCEAEGIIHESEVVDHVIPFPLCGDFWNKENWQAICQRHNIEKGNRDKKMLNGRDRDTSNR